MSNIRRKLLSNKQEDNKLYTECTNASSYLELPYNIKDFRFKLKCEFSHLSIPSNRYNDSVLSIGAGSFGFSAYNQSSDYFYNRLKAVYYSSATLQGRASKNLFESPEVNKLYDVEFSYVNNVLTYYLNGNFIYSYSDSRYVIRSLYLFNNITKTEGSYSRIYEAKIYTSNDDSSIVYDLIPYEDPITHYGGFKDKLTGNVYTTSGLIIGAK